MADNEWTPLQALLQSSPEGLLAGDCSCYHWCGGPHLKRDCPQLQQDNGAGNDGPPAGAASRGTNTGGSTGGNTEGSSTHGTRNCTNTTPGVSTTPHQCCGKAAWKYIPTADENQTVEVPAIVTESGEVTTEMQTWKWCKHCVCCSTQKVGFYNPSHTTTDHDSNFSRRPQAKMVEVMTKDNEEGEPTNANLPPTVEEVEEVKDPD